MLRLPLLRLSVIGAISLLLATPVAARVLTLSHQTDTSAIVRDAVAGDSTVGALASPQGRLLVGVGLLAADAAHDLVYVAVNADPAGPAAGTPATLLVDAYGSVPVPLGSLSAPSGRYFSALVFDAPTSRLIGVVSDPTNVAAAKTFVATTSNGSLFGVPAYVDTTAGCCRLASGIAAWRASTQELFMVGRRSADTADQLLRFNLAAASPGPDAYPIAGDSVVALAVDSLSGNLYAIARSVLNVTHLAQVTYSTPGTPANLSAIGSTPAQCCYVATGPATIDGTGAARALYALTRDATAPATMRLSSFNLASGNAVVVNGAMDGYGLWSDPAAQFDRIFANGFD
jgi:hypothetical protein